MDADYKKGEVYVKFERGKTDVDEIVKAINKAGYNGSMRDKTKGG